MASGQREVGPRRLGWALLITGSLVSVLWGCSNEPAPSDRGASDGSVSPAGKTRLGIPDRPLVLLQPGGAADATPVQLGTARLRLGVATVAGGQLSTAPAASRGDLAFAFPTFQPAGPYPRAVVVAQSSTDEDQLSLGTADFSYGADLRLDRTSDGRSDDNGNNVIQRGLATDEEMFKLEVDKSRPGCTVKGRAGSASVFDTDLVEPGRWYRVRCERTQDGVTIYVGDIRPDGTVTAAGRTKASPTGQITMPESVPLSVGGKVGSDGAVFTSASDQFNGSIANPFLLLRRAR